jgi:hypothetical protein
MLLNSHCAAPACLPQVLLVLPDSRQELALIMHMDKYKGRSAPCQEVQSSASWNGSKPVVFVVAVVHLGVACGGWCPYFQYNLPLHPKHYA